MRRMTALPWWQSCPDRDLRLQRIWKTDVMVEECHMNRATICCAMLIAVQVLASSLTYASGVQGATYYGFGSLGEKMQDVGFPAHVVREQLPPSTPVNSPPVVSKVSGPRSHAPDPFSCQGGYKFVRKGSIVVKEICD